MPVDKNVVSDSDHGSLAWNISDCKKIPSDKSNSVQSNKVELLKNRFSCTRVESSEAATNSKSAGFAKNARTKLEGLSTSGALKAKRGIIKPSKKYVRHFPMIMINDSELIRKQIFLIRKICFS